MSTVPFTKAASGAPRTGADGAHTHAHDHAHDHAHSHSHSHAANEHGHTHEIMEHPGKFGERDLPNFSHRNWNERAFTVGIGGYVSVSRLTPAPLDRVRPRCCSPCVARYATSTTLPW